MTIIEEKTEAIRSAVNGERGRDPIRYMVWTLVAIAFTCLVLQYSMRYHRLAYPLTQDDITYVEDGLDRLNVFYSQGTQGSAYFFRISPPRAPVESYMASLGFALFGFRDWAPYATNAVWIFVLLWAIAIAMEGTRLWHKAAAFVFVLCCPVTILMVNEFRPDLACGLVTAIGIITVLRKPFVQSSPRDKLATGALFGAALLIKPSIFPGTIVFAVAAISLAALRDFVIAKGKPAWGEGFKSVFLALAAMVGVVLPYVYYAWRMMWDYLAANLLDASHRKAWEIPGGLIVQLRYYLDGPGGQFLMGGYLRLCFSILILGTVGVFLTRKRWPICTWLCAAAMMGVTFLTPSLTPGKNTFGGATYTWLLILSCILLFKSAVEYNRRLLPGVPWAGILLLYSSLASFGGLHLPAIWTESERPSPRGTNEFVSDVFDTLMDKLDEAPLGKRRVFVTTYGLINYQLLKYLSIREDRRPHEVPFLVPPDRADLALFEQQMNKADLTLASESGSGFIAAMLPSASMQDQSLALALGRPDMVEIRRFAAPNGKQFHLLEKRWFAGWYRSEGFSLEQESSADRQFPRFRVGYGPSSRLFMTRFEDGTSSLNLRCESLVPVQHVLLNVDGGRAAEVDIKSQDGFRDFKYALKLDRGNHVIEFLYSDWQRGDVPSAVEFAEISLLPDGAVAGKVADRPRPEAPAKKGPSR